MIEAEPTEIGGVPFPIVAYVSERHVNRFIDPWLEDNQEIRSATMQAVDRGRHGAYFVPIVKFAVDIALDVWRHSDTHGLLPNEVTERAAAAREIAEWVASRATENGLLRHIYAKDRFLRKGLFLDPVLELNLTQAWYIASQCGSPFSDAARPAGGAYDATRNLKATRQERVAAIAASRSLPLVSTIPHDHESRERTIDALIRLGTPYALAHHIEATRHHGQLAVDFNQRAVKLLGGYALPMRGCPATVVQRQRRGAEDGPTTILKSGWRDIVHFLLRDDPKVTRDSRAINRQRPGKKRRR